MITSSYVAIITVNFLDMGSVDVISPFFKSDIKLAAKVLQGWMS